MLALGSVKTIITENVKNGRIQFDMHGFLAGVILADLNLAGESSQQKIGTKTHNFLQRINFEFCVVSFVSSDLTKA